ncbi:hypothetical protein EYF80_002393 [Liparis tanakae]|uniref:Uncharacterized protein n=1 Tax=Liparis tanakae TaxID=230148 RepID=A0A4Z2JB32_9TELE|nr:hypothetical protein EYF80_002393 [Liparis tanakae]
MKTTVPLGMWRPSMVTSEVVDRHEADEAHGFVDEGVHHFINELFEFDLYFRVFSQQKKNPVRSGGDEIQTCTNQIGHHPLCVTFVLGHADHAGGTKPSSLPLSVALTEHRRGFSVSPYEQSRVRGSDGFPSNLHWCSRMAVNKNTSTMAI